MYAASFCSAHYLQAAKPLQSFSGQSFVGDDTHLPSHPCCILTEVFCSSSARGQLRAQELRAGHTSSLAMTIRSHIIQTC